MTFLFLLGQLEQSPALGRVHLEIRYDVYGAARRVRKESLQLLHSFLLELFVRFHHVNAGFGDKLKDLCIGLRRLSQTFLHHLGEN